MERGRASARTLLFSIASALLAIGVALLIGGAPPDPVGTVKQLPALAAPAFQEAPVIPPSGPPYPTSVNWVHVPSGTTNLDNWSGYIITDPSNSFAENPNGPYTNYYNFTFTVPVIKKDRNARCLFYKGHALQTFTIWFGIDGYVTKKGGNTIFPQAGISAQLFCDAGDQVAWAAWVEWPPGATQSVPFAFSSGQEVNMDFQAGNDFQNSSGVYEPGAFVHFTNNSTGGAAQTSFGPPANVPPGYQISGHTVEWIVERQTFLTSKGKPVLSPLADYGTVDAEGTASQVNNGSGDDVYFTPYGYLSDPGYSAPQYDWTRAGMKEDQKIVSLTTLTGAQLPGQFVFHFR
jgi:hypothetical protein